MQIPQAERGMPDLAALPDFNPASERLVRATVRARLLNRARYCIVKVPDAALVPVVPFPLQFGRPPVPL